MTPKKMFVLALLIITTSVDGRLVRDAAQSQWNYFADTVVKNLELDVNLVKEVKVQDTEQKDDTKNTKHWTGYIQEDKQKLHLNFTTVPDEATGVSKGKGKGQGGVFESFTIKGQIDRNGDGVFEIKFGSTTHVEGKLTCNGKYKDGQFKGKYLYKGTAGGTFKLTKGDDKKWEGTWEQGSNPAQSHQHGHEAREFKLEWAKINGLDDTPGEITGNGNTEIGKFTITEGSIDSNNKVQMMFTYDADQNKFHWVGVYNAKNGTIEGKWEVREYHDDCLFEEIKQN